MTSVSVFGINFIGNIEEKKLSNSTTSYAKEITIKNTIWIDSSVPPVPKNAVLDFINKNRKYEIIENRDEAEVLVKNEGEENIIYKKYFVPVTNFSSLKDKASLQELAGIFTKENNINKYHLKDDSKSLKNYFGDLFYSQEKESISEIIDIIGANDIALIPFEKLEPELKILRIEGENIFDKNYSDVVIDYYPCIKTSIKSQNLNSNTLEKLKGYLDKNIQGSNRDITKLSTLAMTGVTAISRGVETTISYKKDPAYPARAIMDVMSKHDLTHVDSENPFFDECPKVEADSLTLCGKTTSIESLKAIGTDIVDLTGNHQNDFGPEKCLESIEHLEDAGFEYFGGGKNEEDANKVLYKEINGTRLAFLGYAYFDSMNGAHYKSLAYENRPGANFYSEEKVKEDIIKARENADFVIVDYQFTESYNYNPLPEQRTVFRKTIEAGADIVVGVQAHQPQEIEFWKNGTIFYGLGNLFFDQMWSHPTRQGIIPVYNFYDGKLISIEILTTLLYEYSQPRFTSGEERIRLLKEILP